MMIKNYLVGIFAVIVALFAMGALQSVITGNIVKEKPDENVVIYFPKSADFPNPEGSAAVFEFSFPDAAFMVGNKTADILMFLNSDTVSGLKIGYDTREKKIKAGLPVLVSQEVTILDGTPHKIMYSFIKAEKKQAIYLDDNLLAEGEYTGEKTSDSLSGFSVLQKWTYIQSPLGMNVRFE